MTRTFLFLLSTLAVVLAGCATEDESTPTGDEGLGSGGDESAPNVANGTSLPTPTGPSPTATPAPSPTPAPTPTGGASPEVAGMCIAEAPDCEDMIALTPPANATGAMV